MHMKPVEIVVDKTIPECNYPKPALVSRNVPLNYLKSAYDLIQKHIAEGIITPVDIRAQGGWGLSSYGDGFSGVK